jgi:tRNA A-37 threonylcarbamoyl transferase component Bud32
MAFVEITPEYQDFLQRHGLTTAEQFLALSGVIVCGHPNRHVAQLTVGEGPDALGAFLKREHHVPWRDRLVNAWEGFGLVSRSCREARMLRQLRAQGIGCPEVLAAGEDRQGRAFLLVREVAGAVELRRFLQERRDSPVPERLRFARRLGATLARMHAAGFDHLDLYAKHVLVTEPDESAHFLDWQRSRRPQRLDWHQRCRALAGLDASLADDLATPQERLAFLGGYLRQYRMQPTAGIRRLRAIIWEILPIRRRLLSRRHIREQRQPLPATGTQNLIWLDGEALCVTREFRAALDGEIPAWLTDAEFPAATQNVVTRTVVTVPTARQALLVRRRASKPLHWFWTWLRWRPWTAPELKQAGTLFRLQRYGIATPRLLAVGQRFLRPWKTESFLLTQTPLGTTGLVDWLAERNGAPADLAERRQVVRAAGALLRRLHEAGCAIACRPRGGPAWLLRVATGAEGPAVVLDTVEGIRLRRQLHPRRTRHDLRALRTVLVRAGGSRTDWMRFLLAYLDQRRLTGIGKRLFRSFV